MSCKLDIAALKALLAKATDGSWRVDEFGDIWSKDANGVEVNRADNACAAVAPYVVALLNAAPSLIAAAERAERYEEALRSIAANSCCNRCREAALVAQSALAPEPEVAPEDMGNLPGEDAER